MAYVPKIFKDRSVEFPFRRLLTPVSGQANTVDVSRVPGTIFEVGDEPDAENLNAEFGKIKTETDAINTSLTANAKKYQATYQDTKYGWTVDGIFYPLLSGAELLWTNSAPTTNFNAQTVALDLSEYVGVGIIARYTTTADDKSRTVCVGKIGSVNYNFLVASRYVEDAWVRAFKSNSTGVVFSTGRNANITSAAQIIPLYIFGLKNMLGFEDYID